MPLQQAGTLKDDPRAITCKPDVVLSLTKRRS
jgi:hypothetical protein